MLGELLKAIKTRWAAKSMGVSFSGGFHEGQAPPKTVLPYVVYRVIGSSLTGRATSDGDNQFQQYETVTIDFVIVCRSGLSATSALAENVKSAFDNARMTLGGSVTLKKFWYVGESVEDDLDHTNVKEWTLTYQAVLEQSKKLVNQ
jgi:hypothetical protein